MPIVDAHVHVGLTKYVAVEVLVAQMQTAGVDQALLVQYGGCTDNAYLHQCMQRYPGRFAALGAVDYLAADACQQICRQVTEYGLAGLRIPATLEREDVWRTVGQLGLVASLTGKVEQFCAPPMVDRMRAHPNATFRLEHLGAAPDPGGSPDDPRYARLMDLAALPNTWLMLSGFYGFGRSFPYRELEPFVERALRCFGARRLSWGSDFPPVTRHETYEMTLAMPRAWGFVTAEDLEWILGGTAKKLLGLDA